MSPLGRASVFVQSVAQRLRVAASRLAHSRYRKASTSGTRQMWGAFQESWVAIKAGGGYRMRAKLPVGLRPRGSAVGHAADQPHRACRLVIVAVKEWQPAMLLGILFHQGWDVYRSVQHGLEDAR